MIKVSKASKSMNYYHLYSQKVQYICFVLVIFSKSIFARIMMLTIFCFIQSHFLGQKGMVEDEFYDRVIDGMAFHSLISDRGPPYRACDIFDEVRVE